MGNKDRNYNFCGTTLIAVKITTAQPDADTPAAL